MNRYLQLTVLIVTASMLGACTANIDTPWDRKALDPGQITTMKPLEIPPTFDELPAVEKKGEEATNEQDNESNATYVPNWISSKMPEDPDLVPELSLEQKLNRNSDGSLSRNKEERLPSWLGPEKKSE
jgi:hypothetical protein